MPGVSNKIQFFWLSGTLAGGLTETFECTFDINKHYRFGNFFFGLGYILLFRKS